MIEMGSVLNPFGILEGKMVAVDDVPRGESGVVCPACADTLIARKGKVVMHHFSHKVKAESSGCGETALHRFAKQYLATCKGKHLKLPALGVRDNLAMIRSAQAELKFPKSIDRRADVGLSVAVRLTYAKGEQEYDEPFPLAFEICVTHPKDSEYVQDVKRASIYALEHNITLESVIEWKRFSPSYTWENAIKHLVLNSSSGKRWLHAPPGVADKLCSCGAYEIDKGVERRDFVTIAGPCFVPDAEYYGTPLSMKFAFGARRDRT